MGSLPWSPSIENSAATRGFDGSRRGQGAGAAKKQAPRASGDAGTRPALTKNCLADGVTAAPRGGSCQQADTAAPWPSSRRRAPPPSASPSM